VAVVLGTGGEAEVRLSIIEAIEVNVVDDEGRGDFYYAAVHVDGRGFAPSADSGVAFSVEGVAVPGDVPAVFVQSVVIFGVDDGEFALSQGYSSEGVAEAEAAIEKQQEDQNFLQPGWDGNNYLDG
jgi:hypothetical protein